jgi:hypothetical protein
MCMYVHLQPYGAVTEAAECPSPTAAHVAPSGTAAALSWQLLLSCALPQAAPHMQLIMQACTA